MIGTRTQKARSKMAKTIKQRLEDLEKRQGDQDVKIKVNLVDITDDWGSDPNTIYIPSKKQLERVSAKDKKHD
jgi:K+-transporting ATPase c subunit